MYAFHESYLSDAMRNMAEFTEYACEDVGVGPDECMPVFIISGFASAWENGDPRVLAGMSGIELFMRAEEKCGIKRDLYPDASIWYDTGEFYWSGYILAYLQWKTGLKFSSIMNAINLSDIIRMYPALHTASEDKGVDEIMDQIQKKQMVSRLQEYRKKLGLSQSQLAKLADVNLRTLQQYEIGNKDIKKASADKIISLSKVLGCQPEELLYSI